MGLIRVLFAWHLFSYLWGTYITWKQNEQMNLPAKPSHNRKLALLGVAMTKARNPKESLLALKLVRDEIEPILIESGYCEGAPFSWVTISIRYGIKKDTKPNYQAINKKYGDLPLVIEVPTQEMQGASMEDLTKIFRNAAIKALIHAGEKHDRPIKALKLFAEQMGS